MSWIRHVLCISFTAVIGFDAGIAGAAQSFPTKPIRFVTSSAGGGADFVARLVATGISGPLGQQVIVDNRGGTSVIAAEIVARAPPDGYTLLVFGSPLWILPLLRDNVPYDPVKDFSPVTLAVRAPTILLATPALPANSVKELIALAKASPGKLNYASIATGSVNHLGAELFKAMAGVDIVRISYKSTASAISDLLSGQVQIMFATGTSAAPHVKSGRLKALAVTSAQRFPLFPDLPTVAASGLPGFESVSMFGIFAPARTPVALIGRLNQEMVRLLGRADVKEKFLTDGAEAVGSSPEAFGIQEPSEMTRFGKVIKDAGIRDE